MTGRSLLASVALLLGACGTEREALRIGVLVWPPYELAYLAQHRGYFDPGEIELVDYQTPAEVIRAYRYGLIDACFLTTQFILSDRGATAPSRIAYVVDRSAGGDALLARPEIGSLAALAGRRIAVEAGPLGGYMLRRVLDFADLDPEDVELAYIDTPDHVAAFRDDTVDASITYEPYRSRILQLGAVELFSSRQIPGEIIDGLLVPERVLATRDAVLRTFVRALERARQDLLDSPDEALGVMAGREGLSPPELARALDGMELVSLEENHRLLAGPSPELAPFLAQQAEVMRRAGLTERSIDPRSLIDARLLAGSGD
jgi:NitT/TauT family transport system substrate-binding protein